MIASEPRDLRFDPDPGIARGPEARSTGDWIGLAGFLWFALAACQGLAHALTAPSPDIDFVGGRVIEAIVALCLITLGSQLPRSQPRATVAWDDAPNFYREET